MKFLVVLFLIIDTIKYINKITNKICKNGNKKENNKNIE